MQQPSRYIHYILWPVFKCRVMQVWNASWLLKIYGTAWQSSQTRGLCLMKWPSKTLQNLPYVWNMETNIVFFFIFHFVLLYFSQMNALVYVDISNTHSLGGKIKSHEMKKTTWIFVFQKYGKTWSVSLGHFIKHKLLISEEWRSWLLMLDLRVWLF